MDFALLDLGVIIVTAAGLGMIAYLFRQPPLLGYILAGFVLSIFFFNDPATTETLHLFSKLGVAFLLFMLGIELNVVEIREVGLVSLATGIGQVAVTSIMGFSLAYFLFGYGVVEAAYISIALTFSSTIIIIKLLGEKGDLNSLYGRISVGMLIVQDLIAILALITLTALGQVGTVTLASLPVELFSIGLLGFLLVALAYVFGRLLNIILALFARSSEILLLIVIGWALFAATATQYLGFSIEVGAFLAGLVLATSPFNVEIAAKIKPLRDFFVIMFFVLLGTALSVDGFKQDFVQVGIFSASVLFGNPLILLAILGLMGYHRRVSFLTGLTVSQISEFSLVLVSTGVALGQVQGQTLAMVTGVGVVTLVGSSYLIYHGDNIYQTLSSPLKIFQRRRLSTHLPAIREVKAQVLLIGGHQMGRLVLDKCAREGVSIAVVDYDPLTVRRLKDRGVNAIYGDVADRELLDELDMSQVRVVISTVPALEDNLILLSQLAEKKKARAARVDPMDLKIVVRAKDADQAEEMERYGADYTLVPELAAGEKVVEILTRHALLEKIPDAN